MEQVALTPWAKMNDETLKKRFIALYRVRPQNLQGRIEAAMLTFNSTADDFLALKAAEEWPYDRVCIAEREKLDSAQAETDLPSREQQARQIWNLANDETKSVAERLQAHKLYAEIQGNITKPGLVAPVGNVYNDNRRVMFYPMIPQRADDIDAWEKQAIEQQARLVADAATN